MKNGVKRGFKKLFLGTLLSAVVLQPFSGTLTGLNHLQTVNAQEDTVSLKSITAQEGIILQMHMWSFNNIKSKLPEIAAAGYKSIQVSPIQGCKSGSEWWNLYQPTNQTIGNPLGSREDFQSLCTEAEKYGIDIIVDAVMNHMANKSDTQMDEVSDQVVSEFQNYNYYHNQGQCSQWKNRWAVTQQGIGMPDLNTQSSEVQQKAKNFLNDCIACGADGFRFDAAKHIETNVGVDANQSWAGDYWTNVLGGLTNRDDLFIYGEILDEPDSDSDNILGYASFMSVTDHYYGSTLRNAVKNWNLSAAQNWDVSSLPSGRRVAYVENHDNYEHNESGISDDQRKIAWGMLAARNDVTPMYLSRRTGSVGSMGTCDFADGEIAAINWFHNAMSGQNEYLRYANNNQCVQVDRGTIGTALVNEGGSFTINNPTNLKDGTYQDKGGSGATFTVSNGQISGNVPGNRIVVLYNVSTGPVDPITDTVSVSPKTPVIGEKVTITYNSSNRPLSGSGSVTIHWGYDGWEEVTDTIMTKEENNKWTVTFTVPEEAADKLDFCFTNGSSWDNNSSSNWSVELTKEAVSTDIYAYFDNSSCQWDKVYIYVYDESGTSVKEVAAWPGTAMTKESGNLYSYKLPDDFSKTNTRVIFTNGSAQTPGVGEAGYLLTETMIYQNGSWTKYTK